MATTYSKVKKSYYELGIIPELLKLMKPRVMSLVIFTCAVGLLTAPTSVSFQQSVIGILIVAFGAGAAGALNMWYEADLDKLMSRTCLRPIPRGKLNRNQALYFGTSTVSYFSCKLILCYKCFISISIIVYDYYFTYLFIQFG